MEFLSTTERSRLHTWPIASPQSFQMVSNSIGLDQYLGNNENMVCFKSFNSVVGKAGYFPKPIRVHCASTSSPKK